MGFDKCKICKEYHFDDRPCDPIFEVYHFDYAGDEPIQIRARNHESAAEKYAVLYNSKRDNALLDGDEIIIVVYDENLRYMNFCVTAEPSIQFNVQEIEPE